MNIHVTFAGPIRTARFLVFSLNHAKCSLFGPRNYVLLLFLFIFNIDIDVVIFLKTIFFGAATKNSKLKYSNRCNFRIFRTISTKVRSFERLLHVVRKPI